MLLVIIFLTANSLTWAFQPILTSQIITNLETTTDLSYSILLIIFIFSLNISGWIFNYVRILFSSRVIANVVLDIRKEAHQSVVNHDLSFFDRNPIGKVVSRINSDSRDFGQTVELAIEVIASVVVLIFLMMVIIFILQVV